MSKDIISPVEGQVKSINIKPGESIKKDKTILAIMDVMKMEISLYAEDNGKIKKINIKEGDTVHQGEPLFVLE